MTLQLDARQRAMLEEMGVQVWAPAATSPQAPPPQAEVQTAVSHAPPARPPVTVPAAALNLQPAAAEVQPLQDLDWQALEEAAAACRACGLCAGRKNSTLRAPVQPQATWMVVGDPPQDDDDRAGQAFAGEAGVLLDNMLRAVAASRADAGAPGYTAAYATHVVKCRPPHGQLPQPADMAQCARYLDREIDLVKPRVLFAVGRFAIAALLREHPEAAAQPLGRQRGSVYRYRGIPVVVSYAPQALMRNGADKAKAWADLCLALEQLEGSLPTMGA